VSDARPTPDTEFTGLTRVDTAQRAMTDAFRSAGFETPDLDARFLLQGVLGLDGAALLKDPQQQLSEAADKLKQAMVRRIAGEPVSRILGFRDFYGRRFAITPDVLDPRPDTETLVELALEIVDANGWRKRPIAIADIGTGSGILIVTLLAELPLATGLATDVGPAALDVARANASAHGIGSDRVSFTEARGLGGATQIFGKAFDLIVSNPPYIPTADFAGLEPGVRRFDPALALDGGPDGLGIYREIVNEIRLLDKNTWLALEIGAGQADDVTALFAKSGVRAAQQRRDLGGHVRAVAFQHHR
jgi:release factor glutamine methyltransferase